MYIFTFKAQRTDGSIVKGQLKAKDQNQAIHLLKVKQLQPIIIRKKTNALRSTFGSGSVAQKDLVVFSRQLAFLVSSGVPIMQSLQTIQPMTQSVILKNVLSQMIKDIDSGKNLSEAIAEHPIIFNNLVFSLVQAGEVSGQLSLLLTQLADDLESSDKIKNKVKKALYYPIFVLVVGVGIVIGLMTFVVPRFASIFESSGSDLPYVTKILMSISDFFVNNIFFVIFIVIFIPIALFAYLASPIGRKLRDQLFWFLPIVGPLVRKNCFSRFTKTLACLMRAGVNVVEALNNSAIASNNYLIEQAISHAVIRVEKGKTISESLKKERLFPDLIPRMISIGEETGKVDATLQKVSEFYEEQVKTASATISDMIQPVFIVALGGLVAFVVIAMYLPMFKMAGVVGGM